MGRGRLTICGKSRESLPMVLKTRSWSLFTILSKSSPNDMIAGVRWPACGGREGDGRPSSLG